eukprot:TRINITY_DN17975_c0_g3_i1.p1 TRINITY_DN17975_c0_g3~~TRINITY_DN17975_c0_g3_i1.p1  ORF type:complete len:715 (+),score=148.11 TRINITY_DN17975_c0_g3_i1:58-2145(+)
MLPLLAAACIGWTTMDQVQVLSVADASVSDDGAWVTYSVSGAVEGSTPGVAVGVGEVVMQRSSDNSTANSVTAFCKAKGCSYPRMGHGGNWVGFLSNGQIYTSSLTNGQWSQPIVVHGTQNAGAFRLNPVTDELAFSVAVTEKPSELFREIDEDVIIDVIQDTEKVLKYKICTVKVSSSSPPSCFESVQQSLGAIGWYLSCWPYEAQFEYHPSGNRLAVTSTKNTYTNDWVTFRSAVLPLNTGADATLQLVNEGTTNFQTVYSKSGRYIAYVELDDNGYAWAQDWHICVQDTTDGTKRCAKDFDSTRDQMATLVGFAPGDDSVFYLEQAGTSVKLYQMHLATFTYNEVKVTGVPTCVPGVSKTGCGVIGGGFRASDIPHYSAGSDFIVLAYETMSAPQEVYRCKVGMDEKRMASLSCGKMSEVNQKWIGKGSCEHEVSSYANVNDGVSIEAIHLGSKTASKLIVFTHCGPAMAVLQTYLGYGTVCAAFPVATLVEQGYHVVMPNYRGSTGYGAAMRNSDQYDWGGGDYNDIMSAFITFGEGKTTRSHLGWSYGGYMSALALTKAKTTHGIEITSIVTGGTLTDLISQQGTTDIYKLYKSVFGGYYWSTPELKQVMMENSGIYHVENASAPILMLHGVDDPRMPFSQAYQMHMALKSRGVTTKFVVFPGSGHIPGNPNQRLVIWNQTLSWFGQHNK